MNSEKFLVARLYGEVLQIGFSKKNFPEYQEPDTLLSNINNLSDSDLDLKRFNEILENDVLNAVHEVFQQYLNKLRSENGTMSAF